ncbi:hypothetical protein ACFLY6_00435 [Candidatus Dependentiae bacterium]
MSVVSKKLLVLTIACLVFSFGVRAAQKSSVKKIGQLHQKFMKRRAVLLNRKTKKFNLSLELYFLGLRPEATVSEIFEKVCKYKRQFMTYGRFFKQSDVWLCTIYLTARACITAKLCGDGVEENILALFAIGTISEWLGDLSTACPEIAKVLDES